jgi:hypothetical protein
MGILGLAKQQAFDLLEAGQYGGEKGNRVQDQLPDK